MFNSPVIKLQSIFKLWKSLFNKYKIVAEDTRAIKTFEGPGFWSHHPPALHSIIYCKNKHPFNLSQICELYSHSFYAIAKLISSH